MKISIRQKTEWSDVLNAARYTVGKSALYKEPSNKFKRSILIAEHSPIRELIFDVEIIDVPYFVVMHLVRHNAGINWFVTTSREDKTGVPRNERKQTDLVTVHFSLNAQAFINISRKRLCKKADNDTRATWEEVIKKLSEVDPILAEKCVPECIYRNCYCPEIESCGYVNTKGALIKSQNYKLKSESN